MSRFVQRKLPGGGQRDSRDSSRRTRRGWPNGSCRAWQDLRAMHDLRGLCSEKGPSLARCSPGVFPDSDLQGILNTRRAYLAKASSFWMHGGDILPGRGVFTVRGSFGNTSGRYFARMRPFVCPKCASRVLHSEGAPSSVRNESRKRFVSALQGFGVPRRPPLRTLAAALPLPRRPPALRALAAVMLIARKRNRSPQNGARQDNGSFQCSLL